ANVLDKQAREPAALMPEGPFDIADQKKLGLAVMEKLGFDFDHGRLDVSAHPFCGGTPEDVRITTRYDEADFTKALMGVIHETGHALYERGLPNEWHSQPVGQARGMVLHESQSLLMEMQACRSPEFIAFVSGLAKDIFKGDGPAWSPENLGRLYTKVEKGFIRVDADEVTYPAHVILRYRLEKALLADDLALEDLPQAWGDGLESLLGIRPTSDREGCLQDIHWYDGAIGYFPTYSLGAMSAAQLFGSAKAELPNLMNQIGKGDFSALLTWLRTKVHNQASSKSTDELMASATGKSLDPAIFKAHLQARYLDS
ncbi:MAG: carboxypeptidase M32, partial [Alphaproteobacteria bacterium]